MDLIEQLRIKYALITIETDFCDDGCHVQMSWAVYGLLLLVFLIGGLGTRYFVASRRARRRDNKPLQRRKKPVYSSTVLCPLKPPNVPCRATVIYYDFCLSSLITPCCETPFEPIVPANTSSIKQIFSSIKERELICYCDGSYSHWMQIGYAAFRASDGTNRYRFLSPSDPKSGSTRTEVTAACLAIKYARKKGYTTLCIYTDNTKVKQLLTQPKRKDLRQYRDICQVLNLFQKEQGEHALQVIQVRGHTSKAEQKNSKTDKEFAKTDRFVRSKTRQYRRRYNVTFSQTWYHWYAFDQGAYSPWWILKYYW